MKSQLHRSSVARRVNGRRSRSSVEALEQRTFLTSVIVNTTVDAVFPPSTGVVSLRMAVATANSSTTPTTITFDAKVFATPQTITLNSTGLELDNSISQKTTITGPAAGLTVSESPGTSGPILEILNVPATVTGLTFTNGTDVGIQYSGGDLYPLSLSNVTVKTCSEGLQLNGTATLDHVTASNNSLGLGNGGKLTFTNGTISGNSRSGAEGGGIYNSGTATLTDVTISGNSVAGDGAGIGDGGGIANYSTLTLTNVTIAANSSTGRGGGLFNASSLIATNVTIAGNTANQGGGLFNINGGATATISNGVIGGNHVSGIGSAGSDVSGPFASLGYNLVGKTDGSTGWNSFDLTGTVAHPLDPKLGALANNGGPTLTMLPSAGSPAIDHGWNAVIPKGITTDQRGLPRIVNGTVDIGAVEVQPALITGSIAGNVFGDTNANGKLDAGEKALSGVKVYIDTNKNGAIDTGETSVVTDPAGNFKFNLPAGSYRVREVLPTGYAITAPAAGYFDVTLKAGQALTGFAFADAPATAKISGRVFADGNSNGVRDPGELGLGLWQVFIDYNNDGKIDGKDVSVTTDAFGNWSFTGLVAGTYTVRVVQFAGTVATKPAGSVLTIKLIAGQTSTGNLFGEKAIA